ncbi:MAG TPA: hypothetical protein VFW92_11150 [Candidatus Limnocylindrales bacterium]|nr:hypothetical protein [Candidatus Limnocylindrales bacterium]
MKAHLLYRDRDLDLGAPEPPGSADLVQDLELETLLAAMARGDAYLNDVARRAILAGLDDPAAVRYRQAILADGLAHPGLLSELYLLAVETIEAEKRIWGGFGLSAQSVLRRSVQALELFAGQLRRLRAIADQRAREVESEGLRTFFAMLQDQLDDAYLAGVDEHIERLRFRYGVALSARLGPANRGADYVLRTPRRRRPSLRERIGLGDGKSYVYQVPDRDEAGFAALSAIEERGLGLAADALARSTDHILDFFRLLRAELGVYVGWLNLQARLTELRAPTCLPEPLAPGQLDLETAGLYDPCLLLVSGQAVVGNDVAAPGRALIVVTGANRGGKSTFLRSLGLAQLMLRAGCFVAASSFRADLRTSLFSHFRREEDSSLQSGKFDEELVRMRAIVDHLDGGSLLLLNESFAATNEREGSEIARQVVHALLERGVKVCFVTHMFDLADGFWREGRPDALFLRAERRPDGTRTFRLVEARPLPTSFGQDVYRRVFDLPREAAVVPGGG